MDKATDTCTLSSDYPERGCVSLTPRRDCDVAFRLYDFMGHDISFTLDGKPASAEEKDGLAVIRGVKAGQTAALHHPLRSRFKKEVCAGREYKALWRGPDVVDILPRGEHLRLFQRDLKKEQYLPKPEDVTYTGAANYGPTQQKK